jgi:polysaccharide pyruvyl transferase CsaB
MKKQVIIAGYYGFNNAGDESILAVLLADLRALEPGLQPLVISGDPAATAELYQVEAILWTDLEAILAAAQAADLIILGGGGIFHDYWGFNPDTLLDQNHAALSYFAGIPLLATLFGKPCMLYSIGVGPLFSTAGKAFMRASVEQAWITTVRDPESKTYLEALGVAPERVHVTADPAFRLPAATPQHAQQMLERENIATTETPVLGVCLRHWDVGVNPEHWEAEVARALDLFLERRGGVIRFLQFQVLDGALLDDAVLAERVKSFMRHSARAALWQGSYTPQERAALLGTCDIVLGMRLHSLILALGRHKPVVALVYDPKISSVMRQAGCAEWMLPIESVTASALFDLLNDAYLTREQRQAGLSAAVNQLAQAAHTNAQLAVSLLHEPLPPAPAVTTETLALLKMLALNRTRQAQSLLRQCNQYHQTISQLKADHEALRHVNRNAQQQLDTIYRSTYWKWLSRYWRLKTKLGLNRNTIQNSGAMFH